MMAVLLFSCSGFLTRSRWLVPELVVWLLWCWHRARFEHHCLGTLLMGSQI